MTRNQYQAEAVRFMEQAIEAFDQALVCMRKACNVPYVGGYHPQSASLIYSRCGLVLKSLREDKCEECAGAFPCDCDYMNSDPKVVS